MRKKATRKNFEKVLDNFKAFYIDEVKGTGVSEIAFINDFNTFLDDLASDDVFGTEGQLDPRGDQRD